MKKTILLATGVLALSSMIFGAPSTPTDTTGHVDTGTFTLSAQVITNLDVDISGDMAFGDVVIPDSGTNTRTIGTDSTGITVGFNAADKDETVSIVLSGTGVEGSKYTKEAEKVYVDFVTSTGTWTGIPTTAPLYIGGTITVGAGATSSDVDISENITVTVTYDSIV